MVLGNAAQNASAQGKGDEFRDALSDVEERGHRRLSRSFGDTSPTTMATTKYEDQGTSTLEWVRYCTSWAKSNVPRDAWFELMLCGLAIVIACGFLKPHDDKQVARPSRGGISQQLAMDRAVVIRGIIVWLQWVGIFMYNMTNSALIPISYDLILGLGGGATSSGLFLGLMYVPMFLGYIIARSVMQVESQSFKRAFTSTCFLAISAFTLFTAVAASPANWHFGKGLRHTMLFTSRGVLGLLSAGMVSRRMMIQSTLPARASIRFNMGANIATALGIGTGPLAVSFICWAFDARGTAATAAVPLRMLAALCLVVASMWWAWTPRSLEMLLAVKHVDDVEHVPLIDAQQRQIKMSPSLSSLSAQRRLWIAALILGAERAMTISALEVATSLLLEVEHGLSVSTIGYLIGGAFILGLPVIFFLEKLRHSGHVSASSLLLGCTLTCALATPLLLTQVGFLLHPRWATVITADALIFPAAYAVNGVADAIAMSSSETGSFYNQQNYLIASGILQNSVARAIGPPLARYLVSTGGQNAYACFQVIVIGLAFREVLTIRAIIPMKVAS